MYCEWNRVGGLRGKNPKRKNGEKMGLKSRIKAYVAPPGTVWWIQGKINEPSMVRCDHLLGLNRYYFRHYGVYVYILHLGRLKLAFFPKRES
jgi:hypothetical protein